MNLRQMIEKFFTPEDLWRKQQYRAWGRNRPSKHMLPSSMKATKAYADGRQKSPKNQRNMRKRK